MTDLTEDLDGQLVPMVYRLWAQIRYAYTVGCRESKHVNDAAQMAIDVSQELCRLDQVNEELVNALKLALWSHGTMLLSDPPQDAWRTYGVEAKARAAIAKAEDKP